MTQFRKDNINSAKLTPEKVIELRREYHQDRRTQGYLARKYQVSIGQIGRIVRNEVWQEYVVEESPDVLEHRAGKLNISGITAEQLAASQERLMKLLSEAPEPDLPTVSPVLEQMLTDIEEVKRTKEAMDSQLNELLKP